MEPIQNRLTHDRLLCDGAFGTYYALKYHTQELPELANLAHPERVTDIHTEYLTAGAQLLRTNTYASNMAVLGCSRQEVDRNLRLGYQLAAEAASRSGQPVYIAADIGQIPYDDSASREALMQEYTDMCGTFLDEGAQIFVFETFSDMEGLAPALELIGDRAYVILQFAVNQYGYSASGLSARKLLQQAEACPQINAVGLNCGIGPAHMHQLMQRLTPPARKPTTAFPNAGYPQSFRNRTLFPRENIAYFTQRMNELLEDGVSILGGCCGTTPEYIASLRALLEQRKDAGNTPGTASRRQAEPNTLASSHAAQPVTDSSFFAGKEGKKLIAVELAPPFGSDDEKLMDAAHILAQSPVDVLTFPDSPSGRTRADSILTAEKVSQETGLCVMPHICCRDKNAIAMRSQLLGAYINHIHNFLIITGDPIPTLARSTVKSVFNFDSVGLMQIINDMNEEEFAQNPICFGGAINPCRRPEFEIGRIKRKLEAGATFFLTQPISTETGAAFLKMAKEETGARILCGIMPFVSLKNAVFIQNEMAGIEVTEDVLKRYRADMTREEGEQAGIRLAKDVIAMTKDYADGYYFSFPFNRVGMLQRILE